MIKRKVKRNRQHPLGEPRPGETHAYEMKLGARWLRHGDDVRVRGRRGTFRFVRLEEREGREPVVWLWDVGGACRFVRPDALKAAPRRRSARKAA